MAKDASGGPVDAFGGRAFPRAGDIAMHTEIPIKVNAWVDEGIAPVVEALNACSEVMTLDSCQGEEDFCAYVYFKHVGSQEQQSRFFFDLADALSREPDRCGFDLRLEWLAGNAEPMAQICTNHAHVDRLASVLTSAFTSLRKNGTPE